MPDQDIALYNRQLIALSSIPDEARLQKPMHHARAYSPICGSTVEIDLDSKDGRVTAFGYAVEACALTKTVLSVMQKAIIGQSASDIEKVAKEMQKMLSGEAPNFLPAWSELEILAPIKDHVARHNAVMLPFESVEKALKNKE